MEAESERTTWPDHVAPMGLFGRRRKAVAAAGEEEEAGGTARTDTFSAWRLRSPWPPGSHSPGCSLLHLPPIGRALWRHGPLRGHSCSPWCQTTHYRTLALSASSLDSCESHKEQGLRAARLLICLHGSVFACLCVGDVLLLFSKPSGQV